MECEIFGKGNYCQNVAKVIGCTWIFSVFLFCDSYFSINKPSTGSRRISSTNGFKSANG